LQEIFHRVAVWVFHLGGAGLLVVGIADSSPLTMPLANDLLVIALSASHHGRMPYYAAMAAIGSIIGCAITDAVGRKAGKEVQEKVTSRRLKFVETQLKKRAGWTLAVTALLPPPFPFTPFVAVAAGTRYPRQKLLAIVGLARLGRFLAEGALAIGYGRRILGLARSPVLKYSVIALIVVAIVGSGWTVLRWIRPAPGSRRGKRKARGGRSKTAHAA
jgi:membrane protein YqaA with SNARE-associated domain